MSQKPVMVKTGIDLYAQRSMKNWGGSIQVYQDQ